MGKTMNFLRDGAGRGIAVVVIVGAGQSGAVTDVQKEGPAQELRDRNTAIVNVEATTANSSFVLVNKQTGQEERVSVRQAPPQSDTPEPGGGMDDLRKVVRDAVMEDPEGKRVRGTVETHDPPDPIGRTSI